MGNPLDARAKVYCNLGPVISGSLQDSSIIGTGLINVTGTLLLSGVYSVRPGNKVELAYYKDGRVARLGRSLRVISSFANPVTRLTEVSVGCYLTYQQNSSPGSRRLSSASDTNTPELQGIAKLLLRKPISAKFIAEKCCAAVGLQHDPFPLTSRFYTDSFSLDSEYLKIVADLLISESYVGYVDSTERLKFINLNQLSAVGPVLDETRIIDVSPINEGDPGSDVAYSVVQKKTIKLDSSIDANASGLTASTIEEVLERNGIPVNVNTLSIAYGG